MKEEMKAVIVFVIILLNIKFKWDKIFGLELQVYERKSCWSFKGQVDGLVNPGMSLKYLKK